MNRVLIALLTLTISCSAAAEGFSSLEEQMTGKDFSATGLDKLTDSELAALNAWIRARSLATLDAPAAVTDVASDEEDEEEEDQKRTTISSSLVGKFSGWDGQTVFELENGMIWAQADKGKFHIKEIENPAVTIEPGLFGAWNLSIEGYDEDCRVKRIQ
jgi:hypothetical protein